MSLRFIIENALVNEGREEHGEEDLEL